MWRQGPSTDDGYWMVQKHPWGTGAVRVIVDEGAPVLTAEEFMYELKDALVADRIDAQDAYLEAITIAAELPPADLVKLRDAVVAGRAGGAADGTPRKRTRKAAAS